MSKPNSISGQNWRSAISLAHRESREGMKGFRVFALALFLGITAIAAIGSMSAAFVEGLENEKRRLLGGDVEITAINAELNENALNFLTGHGEVSKTVDAQLMAYSRDENTRSVIQLKGVDSAYPLIGEVVLVDHKDELQAVIAPEAEGAEPLWSAVVDRSLLDRLALSPGDHIRIGTALFVVRAAISSEPDRASAGFLLGPRVITSLEGARATGLLETSAMVNHNYRVILDDSDPEAFEVSLRNSFPENSWRIRTATEASAGLARLLRNLSVFLTLIGLGALVIGGVGAANAVRTYMDRKTPVIATLKCLGARGDFILKTYMIQILVIAVFAMVIGLVFGALAPFVATALFGSMLPFEASVGLYPTALLEAAAFGLLTAAAFAFWPLAVARRASAASLFRSLVEKQKNRPSVRDMGIVFALGIAFLALAVALADARQFAMIFIASGVIAYLVLRFLAWGMVFLARRYWRPKKPMARIAAANLIRPGAATASISVSLGLGLTLLSVVSLIDANFSREITNALPVRAPALFFSDIPYADAKQFDDRIKVVAEGATVERYYMLRAGLVALDGKPLSEVEGAKNSSWARDNDWGVTILDRIPPELGDITSGSVWPSDYDGPPLLALSKWQAENFELDVGDTMTLVISGRNVTATIAAIFDQNFENSGLTFVAIFAPGTLEAARPTSIGSLRTADLDVESSVARMIASEFPEVTVIRTRDVIESVRGMIKSVGLVIRALSGLTIAAGVIVLLGAVAADFARKLHDAMVMKTLGAKRSRILTAHAIEYAVLGAGPALAAAGLGMIGSWYVVAQQMEIDWHPAPDVLIAIIFGAVFVTMTIGLAAAFNALRRRPWPVLRAD